MTITMALLDENKTITNILTFSKNEDKEYFLSTLDKNTKFEVLSDNEPVEIYTGYFWDNNLESYIPPKPHDNWIFNESLWVWEPPIPKPTSEPINGMWVWEQGLDEWVDSFTEETE